MDHSNQLKAANAFANSFVQAFSESLTRGLGAPWLFKVSDDPDVAKRLEQAVHFRLSASGGMQGDCFVTFGQDQVIALGSRLLEQPVAEFSEDQAGALAEVMVSAMEGLSSAITAQFGVVTFKVDRVEDVRLDEMLVVSMTASGGEVVDAPVLLYFNEQLMASMTSPSGGESSSKVKRTTIDPANLQLVMDVELNVSLRFGQCRLPLRDVLDLASGSVIELDRDVDDPVELLLDGKVIARGEAVIVDGNYGLRVTEIPEPIASHFVS
jgi:flagellar motor switch protein FliN/FliY